MLVDAILDRVRLEFVVFHVHAESEGRKKMKKMAKIAVGQGKLQGKSKKLSRRIAIHVSRFLE